MSQPDQLEANTVIQVEMREIATRMVVMEKNEGFSKYVGDNTYATYWWCQTWEV